MTTHVPFLGHLLDTLPLAAPHLVALSEDWPPSARDEAMQTYVKSLADATAMRILAYHHREVHCLRCALKFHAHICHYAGRIRSLERRQQAYMQCLAETVAAGAVVATVRAMEERLDDMAVRIRQWRGRMRAFERRLPSRAEVREQVRVYLAVADTVIALHDSLGPLAATVGLAVGDDLNALRAPGAASAFLAPVPVSVTPAVWERQTRVVRAYATGEERPKCPVCLEACEPGETTRLPCKHDFCTSCIKQWAKTSPKCPMCRSDVREGDPPDVPEPAPTPAPALPALTTPAVPAGMTRCDCCDRNYKHYAAHLKTKKHERNAARHRRTAGLVAV